MRRNVINSPAEFISWTIPACGTCTPSFGILSISQMAGCDGPGGVVTIHRWLCEATESWVSRTYDPESRAGRVKGSTTGLAAARNCMTSGFGVVVPGSGGGLSVFTRLIDSPARSRKSTSRSARSPGATIN